MSLKTLFGVDPVRKADNSAQSYDLSRVTISRNRAYIPIGQEWTGSDRCLAVLDRFEDHYGVEITSWSEIVNRSGGCQITSTACLCVTFKPKKKEDG